MQDVYNLGKLQAQLLTFIAGCCVTIAGLVLGVVGMVLERLPAPSIVPLEGDPAPAAASTSDGARYEPTPEEIAAIAAAQSRDMTVAISAAIGLVLLLFVIIYFNNAARNPTPTAAAIEANADMIADNIDAAAEVISAPNPTPSPAATSSGADDVAPDAIDDNSEVGRDNWSGE